MRIVGQVAPPAAKAGDGLEQRPVHVGAEADGADGHALRPHHLRQLRDAPLRRLPVREQDDVLHPRTRHREILVGHVEGREDLGAAPGAEAADVAQDTRPVSRALHAHDALRAAVEADHGDVVVGPEQLRRRLGGFLGELDLLSVHRPGAIDDEGEGEGRLVAPSLGIHAHGQEPFERAPLPATQAEAGLTPAIMKPPPTSRT